MLSNKGNEHKEAPVSSGCLDWGFHTYGPWSQQWDMVAISLIIFYGQWWSHSVQRLAGVLNAFTNKIWDWSCQSAYKPFMWIPPLTSIKPSQHWYQFVDTLPRHWCSVDLVHSQQDHLSLEHFSYSPQSLNSVCHKNIDFVSDLLCMKMIRF